MPSFSSSQDTPDLSESSGCDDHVQPCRQRFPQTAAPIEAALCSSAEVDLTGVSRSVNQPHNAWTLSPYPLKTGCSGSNTALIGAAAALNPSTTPPKNALIGCQYFQTTSATPASAATTRPIGLSRAPSNPEIPYSATRRRASGPDARNEARHRLRIIPRATRPAEFITMPIILREYQTFRREGQQAAHRASASQRVASQPGRTAQRVQGEHQQSGACCRMPPGHGATGKAAHLPARTARRRCGVTADITEGSVFTPSTDRPNNGSPPAAPVRQPRPTASVPSTTVIAAVAAATFIECARQLRVSLNPSTQCPGNVFDVPHDIHQRLAQGFRPGY
ncbi:hypothetical protein L1887_46628 [Cichorium endivia]|nr:hypothetical protein L1887_46628 [Cichorium endivia]